MANELLTAVRRRRIAAERAPIILADLDVLAAAIDASATSRAWSTTFGLAARHGLTVYDAAYLELALRLDVPLASLDTRLVDAARREDVRVISG